MNRTLTTPWLFPLIAREGEGAGGAGATPPAGDTPPAGETPPAGGIQPKFEAKPAEPAPAAPAPGEPAPKWEGPDWVNEKYRGAENPIEEQAKAYAEAQKRLAMKTDDLRKELKTEVEAELAKASGAPEKPEDYAYPDGFDAPAEALDKDFRAWAKKHKLSQDAFNEAVQLYAQTGIDHEGELSKLGANAQARISAMNDWGSRNIDPSLHAAAAKMMQTAEGFEVFESFMLKSRDAGYTPNGGSTPAALTREQIRAKQNDPRWYDPVKRDPAYIAEVQRDWQTYERAQANKR